jgi:hypothetical protein
VAFELLGSLFARCELAIAKVPTGRERLIINIDETGAVRPRMMRRT